MVREVNFRDIDVGDRVMIVSEWVASKRGNENWNHDGLMDHHLGTIMTVKKQTGSVLKMFEDEGEFEGSGWTWFPEMISGLWVDEDLDDDITEWPDDISLIMM